MHDSQKLDDVLDLSNTGKGSADSAYRSVQIEADLKAKGLQSRIHRPPPIEPAPTPLSAPIELAVSPPIEPAPTPLSAPIELAVVTAH